MNRRWFGPGMAVTLILFGGAVGIGAHEEGEAETKDKPWSNKTEFGFTSTSGNADSTNFSLGNNFQYKWTKAEFLVDFAAIKAENTAVTYQLVDPNAPPAQPGNAFINETSAVTAETYDLVATYRRDITKRLFWYVNARWYRNEPSGIVDRYRGGGGIGYKILDLTKHQLFIELGGIYTDESQVDGTSFTYSSARSLLQYDYKISKTAELSSDLEGVLDVDDSDNWQANWVTSITASLTSQLALRVSYTVLYNNLPPLRSIPAGGGTPPGSPALPFPATKTDKFLTASVVLNF